VDVDVVKTVKLFSLIIVKWIVELHTYLIIFVYFVVVEVVVWSFKLTYILE
jgi:hypothetical protein